MEYLHWQYIRPAVDRFWECEDSTQIAPGSAVEAYCDGAWSPGVVRGILGEGKYEVIVNGKEAEQVVNKILELLRPRHEWDGSHWSIASPERQGNTRCHAASGKRPSSPVEVTSSDGEQSNYPECSAIKKANREPELLRIVLAEGSERPSGSRVDSSLSGLSKSPTSNHSLNSCLLSGYLTSPDKSVPTVGEKPISPDPLPNTVLSWNKEEKTSTTEAFKGNNLSSDNRQGNARCHSASGKCPSSPVEVTSSDDEQSNDPECSAIKKAKGEPELLWIVLAEGSERPSGSRVDSSFSGVRKSPASNHSLNSCLLTGYSTPPDKSVPTVGEKPISHGPLPNTVLHGNKAEKTNTVEAFKGNNLSSDNSQANLRPCEKRPRSTVDVASSDDEQSLDPEYSAVKKGKREPEPLQMVCGRTNQRFRRKVICTRLKIFRKKTGSKEACSQHSSFEERNNIKYSKMKINLEYVQSCQNRMAEAESEYAKHLEEKDALEEQVVQARTSWSQLRSFLEENDEAIGVLEGKLGHLRLNGQKIEKDLEHEESKLKRLEEACSDVEKKCDANSQLFDSIKVELQSKLNEGCSQHDSFEQRNDIKHSKMKANLEYVQSCQNRMAEAESEYAKHLEEKDTLEEQVVQTRTSWNQMRSFLEENDEAIGVLEGQLGHLRLNGQEIEKDVGHEESKLERLEEEHSIVEKACADDEQLFDSIKAELLSKLINE